MADFTRTTSMVRGIIAVIVGGIALVKPFTAADVFVVLVGIYLFLDGVVGIFHALKTRQGFSGWWLGMLESAAGLVVALMFILVPRAAVEVLLVLVGVWAIIRGGLELFGLVRGPAGGGPVWIVAAGAALSLVLGAILVISPSVGIVVAVWLFGIYAVVYGILQLVDGLQRRS